MHSLLLERLFLKVATERQVSVVLLAAGAKGIEVPTYDEAKAELEEALVRVPKVEDEKRFQLLKALGLR